MASYLAPHYHLVFGTKNRKPLIHESWRGELHQYLGGTVRGLGGEPECIGGIEDHVHLLVSLNADHRIKDFLCELKKASSRWACQHHRHDFRWQEGYGAFTVSASHQDKVRRYMESQPEHHQKMGFLEEFKLLLEKHGIRYDPKYLD